MLDLLNLSHLVADFRNMNMLVMVVSVIMDNSCDTSSVLMLAVLVAALGHRPLSGYDVSTMRMIGVVTAHIIAIFDNSNFFYDPLRGMRAFMTMYVRNAGDMSTVPVRMTM